MEKNAWMSARTPPASIAPRIPISQEPVHPHTAIPKNAPESIIPSRPMFTTPERSEKMPPIAAKVSGVAARRVAARRLVPKTASSASVCRPTAQSAPAVQTTDRPIAHHPTRRSPRETAHTPAIAPSNPKAIGTPTFRIVHGGRASQKPRTARTMPAIPIECGWPSRRIRALQS
jgi:hypothetical protein